MKDLAFDHDMLSFALFSLIHPYNCITLLVWSSLLPVISPLPFSYLCASLALRPGARGEKKIDFFFYHRAASSSTGSFEAPDGVQRPCLCKVGARGCGCRRGEWL